MNVIVGKRWVSGERFRLSVVDAADRIRTEAREGHEEIKFKQGIAQFVDHAG
jgi:hypothetical protein